MDESYHGPDAQPFDEVEMCAKVHGCGATYAVASIAIEVAALEGVSAD